MIEVKEEQRKKREIRKKEKGKIKIELKPSKTVSLLRSHAAITFSITPIRWPSYKE